MPAQNKMSSAHITAVTEGVRAGRSLREIGEAVGVDHGTVARWARSLGLAPAAPGGPRARRHRRPLPAEHEASCTAVEAGLELNTIEHGRGGETALAVAGRRRRQLTSILDEHAEDLRHGKFNASTYSSLVNLEARAIALIDRLTPRPPRPPEDDPTSMTEGAKLVEKLRSIVREEQAKLVCEKCGKYPWKDSPLKASVPNTSHKESH